ncbi:hypothetical protein SCHPADRAFT_911860, partial [Schizopora paradoxa]
MRSRDLKSRCRSRQVWQVPVSAVQNSKDPATNFLPATSQKVRRCFEIFRLKFRRANSRRSRRKSQSAEEFRHRGHAYSHQD